MKPAKAILVLAIVVLVTALGGRYFLKENPNRTAATYIAHAFTLFGGVGQSGFGDSKSPDALKLPTKVYASVNGGRFDLEGLNVLQFVRKYSPAARAGDAQAAFRVYQAEALCAGLPYTKMRADGGDKFYAQALIDDTAACVGTTPAMEYERYVFLLQAAQAGIDRAANAYFLEGPAGHSTGDPLPAEWTGNTIKFLQAAATQGDTTSMYLLSQIYEKGLVVPVDKQKALTYTVAAFEYNPGRTALENYAIQRRSVGLTPDQVQLAVNQGQELAAQARANKERP
jgi:hypothetical protein